MQAALFFFTSWNDAIVPDVLLRTFPAQRFAIIFFLIIIGKNSDYTCRSKAFVIYINMDKYAI